MKATPSSQAILQAALREIAENAEDWHGPPGDAGHSRALAVIAQKARAALAASEDK